MRFWITLISGALVLLLIFWVGKLVYDLRTRASATNWVDNNRDLANKSAWFLLHAYSDCPSESGNYWPTSRVDCLIPEPDPGPTAADQTIAKDPAGLYYKHLLPTDFYSTIPELLLNIDFTSLTKETLENTLQKAVEANPSKYATISVDSIYLGLEGGVGGTTVRSISLMVHPKLERPISNAIGTLQRAKNLYKPFIEGATGSTISDADLLDIYSAALNRCGQSALNNDQSGRGVIKFVGEYAVVVQAWDSGGTHSLSSTNDCNIHVVKAGTPEPTGITPTFGCIGTSCVPSLTPSPTPIQSGPNPTAEPTVVTAPTLEPEPTSISPNPSVSPPPINGENPRPNGGFLQLLLAFLQLILAFFASLFGGH